MSLRAGLSKVARSVAFASGISTARARARTDLRILALHGVGASGLAAGEFERAMVYLRRDFDVVSLDRMVELVLSSGGAATGQVALTFDDGYRNQVTSALPVLSRLQLPATFFVSPGLIERGEWLWNNEARERLRALQPSVVGDLAREVDAPDESVASLLQMMKGLKPATRQPILDEIRRLTEDFEPTPQQHASYDTVRWEDLASLPPELITVGSQGLEHLDLSSVDDAAIDHELTESRRVLEQRLDRPVAHFCYPSQHHPPQAVARAREIYRSAVGGAIGVARPGTDVHLLPRIPMPRNVPALAWRLDRLTAGR